MSTPFQKQVLGKPVRIQEIDLIIKTIFHSHVKYLLVAGMTLTFEIASLSNAALAQSKPVKINGAESAKLLIEPHAEPVPEPMFKVNTVLRLEFTVLPNGTVTDIIDPSPAGTAVIEVLLPRAKAAVSKWKYRPYLQDGQPAAMRTTVEFHYQGGMPKAVFR